MKTNNNNKIMNKITIIPETQYFTRKSKRFCVWLATFCAKRKRVHVFVCIYIYIYMCVCVCVWFERAVCILWACVLCILDLISIYFHLSIICCCHLVFLILSCFSLLISKLMLERFFPSILLPSYSIFVDFYHFGH